MDVNPDGTCPRCESVLAPPERVEVSDGFRAPSRPQGAGRREVTSQKLDLRDSGLDFAAPPAAPRARPEADRTSRPDWARPRRTRESSVVVAPAGPPQAILWGAGALLAIAVGFALSYLVG